MIKLPCNGRPPCRLVFGDVAGESTLCKPKSVYKTVSTDSSGKRVFGESLGSLLRVFRESSVGLRGVFKTRLQQRELLSLLLSDLIKL